MRGRSFNMRAGLQFVLPVDNNFLPGLQAIVDQSEACLRLRNFNPTHLHALVWLDDVSIGPLRSTLHHVRRNNGRILARRQNQTRVHEFSRPKFKVVIRKSCLQFYRPRRLIDFVIDNR